MVESISKKTDNVFIWCFADQFVKNNGMDGFCTGMFISEMEEAWYYDFYDLNYVFGIDEISMDFPLWIGKTFDDYEKYEFRWLISFKFDFNYNFIF